MCIEATPPRLVAALLCLCQGLSPTVVLIALSPSIVHNKNAKVLEKEPHTCPFLEGDDVHMGYHIEEAIVKEGGLSH